MGQLLQEHLLLEEVYQQQQVSLAAIRCEDTRSQHLSLLNEALTKEKNSEPYWHASVVKDHTHVLVYSLQVFVFLEILLLETHEMFGMVKPVLLWCPHIIPQFVVWTCLCMCFRQE